MVNKKQFGKFQSGVVVFGIIVIALVIALSLFGNASGAFHLVQQPSTPPPAPPEPFIIIDCIQGFVPSQDGLECIRDSNIPVTDIFGVISILLDIPFQTLMTMAVLIIAVVIAIHLILIVRRGKKKWHV